MVCVQPQHGILGRSLSQGEGKRVSTVLVYRHFDKQSEGHLQEASDFQLDGDANRTIELRHCQRPGKHTFGWP